MYGEFEVRTEDGCLWTLSWSRDAAGFFADVWHCTEDGDFDSEDEPECTCPYPNLGVYDTLGTIEIAMGRPIPEDIRKALVAVAHCNPISEADKKAWGRSWATDVARTAPDGTIFCTFAPTWESKPFSTRWDPDNFPLVD